MSDVFLYDEYASFPEMKAKPTTCDACGGPLQKTVHFVEFWSGDERTVQFFCSAECSLVRKSARNS